MASVIAQPLITVADVPASAGWYEAVLGGTCGHAGHGYGRVLVDGELVLQLHAREEAHHHGRLATDGVPVGNGVAVWFGVADIDAGVARATAAGATVQTALHVNPNSGARELWLRDPDDYLVVLAEWPSG
jgi:predicted enzyme related to lactoylglutathione lyase